MLRINLIQHILIIFANWLEEVQGPLTTHTAQEVLQQYNCRILERDLILTKSLEYNYLTDQRK